MKKEDYEIVFCLSCKRFDECLFSVWMVNYCSDYQEETYEFQKVQFDRKPLS